MSTNDKILIIGGGLGGLALAQCLRKTGRDFEVFERDESPEHRSQGWAMMLHWIIPHLLPAIDAANMPPLRSSVSVDAPLFLMPEPGLLDGHTGESKMTPASPEDMKRSVVRANRPALRRWLMTGIDVKWGKKFEKYEELPEGGVRAWFQDGSSAEGAVLVAADGVESHVRAQLYASIPNAPRPQAMPMAIISGLATLTKEEYEFQWSIARSFHMALSKEARMFTSLVRLHPDLQHADYYWAMFFPDPTVSVANMGLHWTDTKSGEELIQITKEKLKDFHPKFHRILDLTDPKNIIRNFRTRTMLPIELPRGRVTMLGDAAHPPTPLRGEGANVAILDAIRLAAAIDYELALSKHLTKEVPDWEDALKVYEKDMIERGTKAVIASQEAADFSRPLDRPGVDLEKKRKEEEGRAKSQQ